MARFAPDQDAQPARLGQHRAGVGRASVTLGSAAHDLAEQLVGLLASAAVRLRVVVVDQVSEHVLRLPLRLDDRRALLLVVRHRPTLLHRCRGDDRGGHRRLRPLPLAAARAPGLRIDVGDGDAASDHSSWNVGTH